ncbi:hypothetical protein [Gloeobacter morelensis]|uniref:hypothetical protein n=1 Tax=Gloeobacter morelensis TaxID=2907343 RepID=UPI001E42499B|nr:hypothetical protein [Gloeobacter morelensis]
MVAKPVAAQSERTIPRLVDLEPVQTGARGLLGSPTAQATPEPAAQRSEDGAEELEELE